MAKMKDGLYPISGGGKVLVVGGRSQYFGRVPQLALDSARPDDDDDDEDGDDTELARVVADAVAHALRRFKAGDRARDERDAERTTEPMPKDSATNYMGQSDISGRAGGGARGIGETPARSALPGRDALPYRTDHRQDFRSGDRRAARDEAIAFDEHGFQIDRKTLLGLN